MIRSNSQQVVGAHGNQSSKDGDTFPLVHRNYRRFDRYNLEVDREQDDKAQQIDVSSIARPHMRAFHCAWWGFFVCFFIWFSINPLLDDIKDELNLTNDDIWISNIASNISVTIVRLVVGILCDALGARTLMCGLLLLSSFPVALTGLVQDLNGLVALRVVIGIAGAGFVACQYWTSQMFTKENAGAANGLSAGWGNLGATVSNVVMGDLLLPLFRSFTTEEIAWRTVCVVPAVVAFISGVVIFFISDDSPKGDYADRRRHSPYPPYPSLPSVLWAWTSADSIILAIQYGCCFGVELTMYAAAADFFREEFGQDDETSASIAAIFGWFNLFARGFGGFLSDACQYKFGSTGRIWFHTILLFLEGILVLVFATTSSFGTSLAALIPFSMLAQAAEGTTFALVPYAGDASNLGSVTGMVGAGGTVGAVLYGLAFLRYDSIIGFRIMAISIIGSSALSYFIRLKPRTSADCGDKPRSDSRLQVLP